MSRKSSFNDFLSNIRLTENQRKDLITGHKTLCDRLKSDTDLSKIIVSIFLQGSYRRSTAHKPRNGKRSDVDVIVVTNLDKCNLSPKDAINKFKPFVEKYYKDKYEIQGRSIGIKLSYVDLNIVITSAPSESDKNILKSASVLTTLPLEELNNEWRMVGSWDEPINQAYWSLERSLATKNTPEWKTAPLWIPDRDADCWIETHPLEQIRWTRDKNKSTNGHYVNVVKAIKWWRNLQLTSLKYPKGYPIEHMIGDCCPDGITSVEEGVVKTLESILFKYSLNRIIGTTPNLPDRGVSNHNVWKRVSAEDFVKFYDSVKEAAKVTRKAFDAEKDKDWHENWISLFGNEFPPLSEEAARAERLAEKSNALNSGAATIGPKLNFVSGTTGVSVPRERYHYDD